jgi:hypothetical protein
VRRHVRAPALDIVEFSSVEEPQRNSRQHTLAVGHFLPVHRGDDFVTPLKAHQEVEITAGAITALLPVPLLEIRQLSGGTDQAPFTLRLRSLLVA